MSSPQKPWENSFNMTEHQKTTVLNSHLDSGKINSPVGTVRVPIGIQPQMQMTPPLPVRRSQPYSPHFYPQGMYGNRFGGYHHPYGYGPMGGYGGYHRMPEDYDSGMLQAAEESCQALFGPFESVVRSVNSIAMVMDSTMQAMQFSFRTVLSAADSISRLKVVLRDLIASIATLRILRTFFYKILKLLGMVRGQPVLHEWMEAFDKAAEATKAGGAAGQPNKSAWPALAFFALMMGGPYLMFKMFSQGTQGKTMGWVPTSENSVGVVATHDFEPGRVGELRMRKGDRLMMRTQPPSKNGWGLVSNGYTTGHVPMNRLRATEQRMKTAPTVTTSNPAIPTQISAQPQPSNIPSQS